MSGVTVHMLDARRRRLSPSARGRRRTLWRRWRRYPPGGRWGVIGGLAAVACLLDWYWGGGPDALGDWIAGIARAALAWSRSVR